MNSFQRKINFFKLEFARVEAENAARELEANKWLKPYREEVVRLIHSFRESQDFNRYFENQWQYAWTGKNLVISGLDQKMNTAIRMIFTQEISNDTNRIESVWVVIEYPNTKESPYQHQFKARSPSECAEKIEDSLAIKIAQKTFCLHDLC